LVQRVETRRPQLRREHPIKCVQCVDDVICDLLQDRIR
jgi:hypothetical protein